MKCIFCGTPDTQVIDSRVGEEGTSIRRRRRCASCSKRFTTYETVELRMPSIVKANGIRDEFDRDKLRTGFVRALHKRFAAKGIAVLDAPVTGFVAAKTRAPSSARAKPAIQPEMQATDSNPTIEPDRNTMSSEAPPDRVEARVAR